MVEKFIQKLRVIYQDCFGEHGAIGEDDNYLFMLGFLKLIDSVVEYSKENLRQEYSNIKDYYGEEGTLFFEIFPDYKDFENISANDLLSEDAAIYNSVTTDNGLFISRDLFYSESEDTIFAIQNHLTNSNFYKTLYSKSKFPNGDNLNFFNVSNYNLNSLGNELIGMFNKYENGFSVNSNQKFFSEFEDLFYDYLVGFDVSTLSLIMKLEPMLMDSIYLSSCFNIFQKLDGIQLDSAIFESKENFFNFLILFTRKILYEDDDLLLSIISYDFSLDGKSHLNILIPRINGLSFLINVINASDYSNMTIYTNKIDLKFKEKLLFSFLGDIVEITQINSQLLDSIDYILYNYDLDYFEILKYFNNNIPAVKLVTPINYSDCLHETFEGIINNDYLESIILLQNKSPLLVLNSNKAKNRLNKFLLIDESVNLPSKNTIKRVFKSYSLFNEYKNSRLISNESINYDSFRNHFNLNNLMYDKFKKVHDVKYDEKTSKFSFDNDDIKVCCLGEIVDFVDMAMKYKIKDNTLYVDNSIDISNLLVMVPDFNPNWVFTSERIVKTNIEEPSDSILISCNIHSEEVLKEYLIYYLNSDKGNEELNFLNRHNSVVYLNDINYIRIPLPDIETQKNIVETARAMDNFFRNILIFHDDFYKNILNYEPTLKALNNFSCQIEFSDVGSVSNLCSNWRIVYQGILWPLAITYLYATKKAKSYESKKEQYVKLFEFFAAFNVIVLISAVPEELYDELISEVWGNFKGLSNITFGKWAYLYKRLTKFYKKHEFDTGIDRSILDEIASRKYSNLFYKLSTKRNEYKGHDSMVVEDDDENLVKSVEELEVYMNNEIFEIMKCYSGLKLYYTTGKDDKDRFEGTIKQKLLILNGPCNPQFYYYMTLNIEDELDPNYLYLYDSSKDSFLRINDSFMKLFKKDKNWLLYIFDGYVKENESKYKCHQKFGEFQDFKDDLFLKELKRFVK